MLHKTYFRTRVRWGRWLLALSMLPAGGRAGAESVGDLADLAADGFVSVSDEQLEAGRRRLAVAAVALERSLVPGSAQGEAWKEYLLWGGVQRQLEPGAEVDLLALRASYDRLTSGAKGLELPGFTAAADAVRRLFDLGLVRRADDQPEYLRQQTQALAKYLERDPTATDPRVSWQIEQRLDLLTGLGQAPELTAALRDGLARPNVFGAASERVLDLLARRPVMEQRPIADSILGTRIVGSGMTSGMTTLSLVPSTHAARLQFDLNGTVNSDTRGYNGPVVICSAGTTRFCGAKVVELTDDAFTVLAAGVDADTTSRTRGIAKRGGKFGERIVRAIAEKRVNESRGTANAIASQKAEEQIAEEFNQQVTDEVRQARRRYDELLRKPLRRRAASPRKTSVSTTSDRLFISALQATPRQLGAPSGPPPAPGGDLSLCVHQSALNNLADAFLGGATFRQRAVDAPIEIDAVIPDRLRRAIADRPVKDPPSDKPFQPWAIELRRERPVSIVFDGGVIRMLLHTTRIDSGEEAYRGWDIEIAYRLMQEDGLWVAEMVGEIDVLPTDFDPGEPGARIASRDRALRRNLAKQLTARTQRDQGFPRRVEIKPFSLARLEKPGLNRLVVRELVSDGGWLSLGLDAQ